MGSLLLESGSGLAVIFTSGDGVVKAPGPAARASEPRAGFPARNRSELADPDRPRVGFDRFPIGVIA